MAIILEQNQQFNWKVLVTILVVVIVVGVGVYFLFFAPVPAIEVIVPSVVRSTTEISNVDFDVTAVANSDSFRALKRYTGQPTVGQIGRVNPFIKY